MKTLSPMLAAAVLVGASTASPAGAAVTTLDFSGAICAGLVCGNHSRIDETYGDGAGVDVSYRSVLAASGDTFEPFLKVWTAGYGDLANVVWGGASATGYRSEITFTALPGFEISLRSFDLATYQGRAPSSPFRIETLGGTDIFTGDIATNGAGHATKIVDSAYVSDGIRLSWGPDGYNVGLDNIVFDVRPAIAIVPEPGAWALMILGFGLAGAVARRRRALAPAF